MCALTKDVIRSITDIAAATAAADSFWVMETDDDSDSKYVQISLAKATMGYESWDNLLVADLPDTSITHRVSMGVERAYWGGATAGETCWCYQPLR